VNQPVPPPVVQLVELTATLWALVGSHPTVHGEPVLSQRINKVEALITFVAFVKPITMCFAVLVPSSLALKRSVTRLAFERVLLAIMLWLAS
jgi:hypothetical protein